MFTCGTMLRAPLFDPTATDDDIKLWNGKTTNLMLLDRPNFQWALQIYNQMREFFWIPQRTDLTGDINDYRNLMNGEQRAYNGILGYLIYLDSVQEAMLPSFGEVMTAPAVRHCVQEQCFFEGIHSESYKYVVEALLPIEERDKIYDFWRTDKILGERCENILAYYQKYLDTRSDEDYFYALYADYLLEGLYFYNGFTAFYVLSTRNLMGGTADIIKQINRDERLHVLLFQKILIEAKNNFTFSEEKVLEMTANAVTQEVRWANHIIGQDFLGITENSIKQYTEYLADLRLRAIGLPTIYGEKNNPYKHLEKVADLGSEAGTKANFFEAQVTSYNMSSAVHGWDDF
jgi:ribonucleoside-diphosphate reductase beta chain